MGKRAGDFGNLRSTLRLCDLCFVDLLRPGDFIGVRLATQDAECRTALQNPGVPDYAARLRIGGAMAGHQYARQSAGRIGRRASADRSWVAGLLLLPFSAAANSGS